MPPIVAGKYLWQPWPGQYWYRSQCLTRRHLERIEILRDGASAHTAADGIYVFNKYLTHHDPGLTGKRWHVGRVCKWVLAVLFSLAG